MDSTVGISRECLNEGIFYLPQQIPCILVNLSERKYQQSIAVGNGVQLLTIQNSESDRYRNEVYTKKRLKVMTTPRVHRIIRDPEGPTGA